MVIHHMPDMVAAIKMFKSMLKPNGLLFIYEFEATDNAKAVKRIANRSFSKSFH